MIRGLSSLGYNNNEQNKSFLNKAKDYYKSIPFFVRIIISNTIVNYIISFFFSLEYGINIPHNTIFKFRIWTLMTTVMITPSLINIIFAFISWIPSGIRDEKEEGTVYFCIQFFIHSIIIQCLFVLMALVLQFLFPDVMNIPSAGLWPYIIAKLTIYCLKNPENIMMFFVFPWPIKAKYYPWILICFFALINMNIQIDLVCAILYGYAYNHKLKNYLEISINFIQKLEDSLIFKYFKNSTGFILLSNSQGSTGFTASTINNLNKNTNKEDYSTKNSSLKPTTPFQGKGVVLGSNNNNNDTSVSTNVLDKTNESNNVNIMDNSKNTIETFEDNTKKYDQPAKKGNYNAL